MLIFFFKILSPIYASPILFVMYMSSLIFAEFLVMISFPKPIDVTEKDDFLEYVVSPPDNFKLYLINYLLIEIDIKFSLFLLNNFLLPLPDINM